MIFANFVNARFLKFYPNGSVSKVLYSLGWGVVLLLITSNNITAQNKGKGAFLQDSIEIGLPVKYALSYRHKPTEDIFFPDSTYNFKPFELLNREFFTTSTKDDVSLDSVVYTLISFEVDAVQKLSLPIYIRAKNDCTTIYTEQDSIYLKKMIDGKTPLADLPLKADIQPIHLNQQANYPLVFMILVGFGILGSIIFWLFGKPIKRQIKLFQFRRRYDEFQRIFQRLSKSTDDTTRRLENVEKAVVLWKKYIERLENKPFTTFTTKEILDNIKDTRLPDALREIDATIYGGNFSKKTVSSLSILQELAEGLYREHRQILIESPV